MVQDNLFTSNKSPLNQFMSGDEPKKRGGGSREGLEFENEIERACFMYQTLKLACIERRQPKAFLGRGKDNKPFVGYAKKTGSDFVGGLLVPEKNTLYLEVKSTVGGSIDMWQENSGIKRHQLEIMKWLEECGFICIFLWEIRESKLVYKFTPLELINGVGGSKKLTIHNCEELKFQKVLRKKQGVNFYWDFLNLL